MPQVEDTHREIATFPCEHSAGLIRQFVRELCAEFGQQLNASTSSMILALQKVFRGPQVTISISGSHSLDER